MELLKVEKLTYDEAVKHGLFVWSEKHYNEKEYTDIFNRMLAIEKNKRMVLENDNFLDRD